MADGARIDVAQRWYSAAELASLQGLPRTLSGVVRVAKREAWESRPRAGRGGGREYPFRALPPEAQAALTMRDARRPSRAPTPKAGDPIRAAWAAYEAGTGKQKEAANRAFGAVSAVAELTARGTPVMQAREIVAAQLQRENLRGASVANLARWQKQVAGAEKSDWVALLMPRYQGRTKVAQIPEQCWDWYREHYLSRARPTHADCYRRIEEMADAQGWSIPSAATFRRRYEREVSQYTTTFHRHGAAAAGQLHPKQTRDALVFASGEAVNGDGLKFDRIWVRFGDERVNTATAWVWQDIRSRKLLAWRLDQTENTDLFRLATYDLTGVCAPRYAWMDNTRVAANKLMTAGAKGRHRFKSDPEDGQGCLLMLGIEPHFTNPSKETGTPGAKPVERAFGIGGLHHSVVSNPRIVEAAPWSRAKAIDADVLREVIATEVARHNSQIGRRTQACRGVLSFDQAWEEGLPAAPRVLSESQRRLLLMCREVVRVNSERGEIQIKAGRWEHGANRYACDALTKFLGKKLAVHFDPANLAADAHIYTLAGRYLFPAEHIPSHAFLTTEGSRDWNRLKQRRIKLRKAAAKNDKQRSDRELRQLYQLCTEAPTPPGDTPTSTSNVVAGHFRRTADPLRDIPAAATGTDAETARDLRLGDFCARALDKMQKDRI